MRVQDFALLLESSFVLTVFNTCGIELLFSELPSPPQVCPKVLPKPSFVSYGNWPVNRKTAFKPNPLCGDKHCKPSTREKKA
jgi:hypothetical protein